MTPENNITLESPLRVLDIGNLILPYLDEIFLGVFGVIAVLALITIAVFLYHWWRYADNAFLAVATPASYAFGVIVLLGSMARIL